MSASIDTSGDDHQVAQWIWRNLVPKSGQATTVQGELLRAVEKLRWEAQNNGNINWDSGFTRLLQFLESTLSAHPVFDSKSRQRLTADLARLRNFLPVEGLDDEADPLNLPYVEDDLYDRPVSFVVAFARAIPTPLPREIDPDLHR